MKKLLALALVAVMAGGALAQEWGDVGGAMGLFFSDTEFTDAFTNSDAAPGAEFFGYVVLLDCPQTSVAGYEVKITTVGATPFVLAVTGPNEWTNFGDATNHLVGYGFPLVVEPDNTAVLATMTFLTTGMALTEFQFGPSEPPSLPDWAGPSYADGEDPTIILACLLTGGVSDEVATVATLYGGGIIATESKSWTDVKSLFD